MYLDTISVEIKKMKVQKVSFDPDFPRKRKPRKLKKLEAISGEAKEEEPVEEYTEEECVEEIVEADVRNQEFIDVVILDFSPTGLLQLHAQNPCYRKG